MKNLTRLGFALVIFGGLLAVAPMMYDAYMLIKQLCFAAGGALIWAGLFRKPAARTALDAPLAALGAAMLISTYFSADRSVSVFGMYPQMFYGLIPLALIAVLFYGAASFGDDEAASDELVRWMLAASIPLALYGFYQRLFGDRITGFTISGGRIVSSIGSPIMLGACLVLLIPLALDGVLRKKSPLAVASLALTSVALIMTWSRGAWLSAVLAVGFYLWATGRMRLRLRHALFIGVAALALLYAASRVLIKADSDAQRLETARTGLIAFTKSPLLGYGPDNFLIPFRRYKTDGYIRATHGTYTDSLNAHNDIIQAAVTLGTLGLLAYLWLLWALVARLHALLKGPEPDGLTAAMAAGLVGLFLQAKVNPIPPPALALAAIMAGLTCRERRALSSAAGRAAASLMAVLCAAGVVLYARFCAADIKFRRGWTTVNFRQLSDPLYMSGVNDLRRATELDPWVFLYTTKRCDVMFRVAPFTPPDQARQLADKSMQVAQEAVRMHPNDATAHGLLATAFALSKRFGGLMMPEAFAEIKIATELDPTLTFNLRRRMDIARAMNDEADFERTKADYLRVIALTNEPADFTPLIH